MNSHIGNRVVIATDELALSQVAVEHVELSFDFHREAVDRVLQPFRRIGIEVPEAPTSEKARSHLPAKYPRQALGARTQVSRQKLAMLLSEVHEDAPDSNTRVGASVLWSTSAGIFELGLAPTRAA